MAEAISRMDRLMAPLNRKTRDGRIESANALKTVLVLKQMDHIKQ